MAFSQVSIAFKDAASEGYDSALASEFSSEHVTRQEFTEAHHTGEGISSKSLAENSGNRTKGQQRKDADKRNANARDQLQLLAQLQQNVGELNGQIANIDAKLDAAERLKQLVQDGEYDPNNPDHSSLTNFVGVDPEDFEKDPINAIDERVADLKEERSDLVVERDKEQNKIDDLVKDNPHLLTAELSSKEAQIKALDSMENAQIASEKIAEIDGQTAELEGLEVDTEIKEFMQQISRYEQFMITGDALTEKMQSHVDGLSDEAKETLENMDETSYLFAEPQEKVEVAQEINQTQSAPSAGMGLGTSV